MFILDVSVGVSVRFYVGDWFSFTFFIFPFGHTFLMSFTLWS